MKRLTLILMAAFGLIMTAHSAYSADIKISSLPFQIVAPGTYVLTGNLSFSAQSGVAINILPNLSGPVILNLKGYTLTGGGGNSIGVFLGFFGPSGSGAPTTSGVTVKNGTIQNFGFGVWAESNNTTNPVLSSIDVNNLTLFISATPAANGAGVIFGQVTSSTISNCNFNGGEYGIEDTQSEGGNRYTNNTFVGVFACLFVTGQNNAVPTVLEHCHFEAPAN